MKARDLLDLKAGRVEFPAFHTRHRDYMRRLAWYFARQLQHLPGVPVDAADLEQLGWVALWRGVERYCFRCDRCRRAARGEVGFDRHRQRRHGGRGSASPDIYRYVHGQVGRAMEHEARRYWRRDKFHGTPPPFWDPGRPPEQHGATELRQVVARAQERLRGRREDIFQRLLAGDRVRKADAEEVRRWLA